MLNSSRELEAHELLVEGELEAHVEGEARRGLRQVRRRFQLRAADVGYAPRTRVIAMDATCTAAPGAACRTVEGQILSCDELGVIH